MTTLTQPAVRWSLLRVTIGSADDAWRRKIAAALAALGARAVEEAPSPAQVWASLSRLPADVLLLTAEPREDAIDLVRRLRAPNLTPCPHIQIVLLTRDLSESEVAAWVKIGVDYLCGWPAPTNIVLGRLVRLITQPILKIALPTYVGPDRRRAPRTAYAGPNRRQIRPPRR